MKDKRIYVTAFDARRLRDLLEAAKVFQYRGRDDLKRLGTELNRATVIAPVEVPSDVITMNSKVRLLDLASNEAMTCTLVFPDEADVIQSKISVLAPLGTAMLGYRVGNVFALEAPAGLRKFKVLEVLYQPEAAGDFHL